jgi:hypothetical protein
LPLDHCFDRHRLPLSCKGSVLAKRGPKEVAMDWPKCLKCNKGVLIPLSDYGQEGASVLFKAWVCNNPECGFSLRVDKGEVTFGKKIDFKH